MAVLALVLALAAVAVAFVTTTQGTTDQVNSQSSQLSSLNSRLQQLQAQLNAERGLDYNGSVPAVNQAPTIRTITETWFLSPSAHQDRFDPSFLVVNQGDTVRLTLIDNDTVAHDFVIGPPYDIIVNATVAGLVNDLTQQVFSTPAANNSPGVVVKGTPGNVSATYSFVASHAGTFEFVCTYHAGVGMIGYLVVLPNLAYTGSSTTTTTGRAGASVGVGMAQGAGANTTSTGFAPDVVKVVLGVNSTVVWTNHDSSPHTVTSNNGVFDSGNVAPGETFEYTFTSQGTYHYHCTYHPWMVGTVIVLPGP